MKTTELASTLTALAQQLSSVTPEAADRIASTLRLSCRRDCGGAPALRLKPLTIAEVQRAVAAALRDAGPRGQRLSRRSYDALWQRAKTNLREQVLADIRSGAAALPGTAAVWRTRQDGEVSARTLDDPGVYTSVQAEFSAACAVARHEVLCRVVPAYSHDALNAWAWARAGEHDALLRLDRRDDILREKLDALCQHGRELARVIVQLDGAGRLVRVLGLDPEPYRAIAAAVAAGEADPLRVLQSP